MAASIAGSSSDGVARCVNSLTLMNMQNIASGDFLCEFVSDYFGTRPWVGQWQLWRGGGWEWFCHQWQWSCWWWPSCVHGGYWTFGRRHLVPGSQWCRRWPRNRAGFPNQLQLQVEWRAALPYSVFIQWTCRHQAAVSGHDTWWAWHCNPCQAIMWNASLVHDNPIVQGPAEITKSTTDGFLPPRLPDLSRRLHVSTRHQLRQVGSLDHEPQGCQCRSMCALQQA